MLRSVKKKGNTLRAKDKNTLPKIIQITLGAKYENTLQARDTNTLWANALISNAHQPPERCCLAAKLLNYLETWFASSLNPFNKLKGTLVGEKLQFVFGSIIKLK